MLQNITGKVIVGKSLGKQIGFPTANIEVDTHKKDIEEGTYKINILLKNKESILGHTLHHGVGVFFKERGLFEAHIFDFDRNIYSETIEVLLLEKIRENEKFENINTLKAQIQKDIEQNKKNPHYVLTFGSFDEIHKGHEFYLGSAKIYGDRLVTIVANSENIEKFKGHKPKYSNEERVQKMRELGISDIVHIGDTQNPLKWLDLYNPRIVCLGYDQVGFSHSLENHIKKEKLEIEIIRVPPYKDSLYKSSLLKK